jgi:DNA-binding IclR family transcriptional regulator
MMARQLARRTGRATMLVRLLLEETQQEGLVERDGEGWRLSADAEREHGPALRMLWPMTQMDHFDEAA